MTITQEGDQLIIKMDLRQGENLFYGLRSMKKIINRSQWQTLRTFCFELRQTMKQLGIVKG
jgi:hypothetical protein